MRVTIFSELGKIGMLKMGFVLVLPDFELYSMGDKFSYVDVNVRLIQQMFKPSFVCFVGCKQKLASLLTKSLD